MSGRAETLPEPTTVMDGTSALSCARAAVGKMAVSNAKKGSGRDFMACPPAKGVLRCTPVTTMLIDRTAVSRGEARPAAGTMPGIGDELRERRVSKNRQPRSLATKLN